VFKRYVRLLILTCIVLLMVTGVVLTAHAGGPAHVPRVPGELADLPGCDVPVSATFYFAKGNDKLFFDDDGDLIRIIAGGPYRVLLESPVASVDLLLAGSAQITMNPDGSQHIAGHGQGLLWDFHFVNAPDFPGIALATGAIEIELRADGTEVLLKAPADVQDLCPALEGAG